MANSVEFAFRSRYNLSPTDPLFLDTPQEMMVKDMLVWHFHHQTIERAQDPEKWELKQLVNQPGFAQRLQDRKREILRDEDWQRRHAWLLRGGVPKQRPVENKKLTVTAKRTIRAPAKP